MLITKLLQVYNSDKKLSVYDSFEGLPEARPVDGTSYKEGYCETSEDVLRGNFKMYNLPLPEIYKAGLKRHCQMGCQNEFLLLILMGIFTIQF